MQTEPTSSRIDDASAASLQNQGPGEALWEPEPEDGGWKYDRFTGRKVWQISDKNPPEKNLEVFVKSLRDRIKPALQQGDVKMLCELDRKIAEQMAEWKLPADVSKLTYARNGGLDITSEEQGGNGHFHLVDLGRSVVTNVPCHPCGESYGIDDGSTSLWVGHNSSQHGVGWSLIRYDSNDYSQQFDVISTEEQFSNLNDLGVYCIAQSYINATPRPELPTPHQPAQDIALG
jgi:hypothetical protein